MKTMATKKYLDYEGLARVIENIDRKYAPIQAIVFKGSVNKVSDLPAEHREDVAGVHDTVLCFLRRSLRSWPARCWSRRWMFLL